MGTEEDLIIVQGLLVFSTNKAELSLLVLPFNGLN